MRAGVFALTVLAGWLGGCGAGAGAGVGMAPGQGQVSGQGAALGQGAAPPSGASGAAAIKLPDVMLVDLERAPRSIDRLRDGRPALLTFWATWCEACQRELAALNRLDQRATGEHAVVIGVAVGEAPAKVRSFVEQHGLRYAQVVDEQFQLSDALGQRRLPATLVVNGAGEVVYSGGALDAEALAAFRKVIGR